MNSKNNSNWHRTALNRRLGADEWTTERRDGTHDWCCPHPSVEDEDFCVFHLPPDHNKKTSSRQNKQFQRAVTGSSDYYRCISEKRCTEFIGSSFINFDLSEETVKSDGSNPINLKHSLFIGETNWRETTFEVPIRLNGARFNNNLKAPNTVFNHRVGFQKVKFTEKVNFNSANFTSRVEFTEADFGKRAIFNHAVFSGRAHFNVATFRNEGSFYASEFHRTAQFSSENNQQDSRKTRFRGPARFSKAQFFDDCQFIKVQFTGGADFSRAVFRNYTGFSGSDFTGGINFEKAVFHDRTYFRGIEPNGEIVFDHCRFTNQGFFNEAVLPKAQFRNATLIEVDFEDATLTGSSFQAANLTGANFFDAELIQSNLEEAIFDKTDLRHTDLTGALWYHAFFTDVRLNDSTIFAGRRIRDDEEIDIENTCQYEILATHEKSVFDRYDNINPRSRSNLWNQASWSYNRLEQISRKNAMANDAIRYHYKKGEADRHQALEENRYGSYLILWAHRLLTGYGDRFLPIGIWSVITVFGSAFFYLLFGIESQDGILYRGFSLTTSKGQEAILTSIQFSIAKFGFGSADFSPVGLSNVVIIVESILGTLLFALLGFVIARRIP